MDGEFREQVPTGIFVDWFPKAITNKEPQTALVVKSFPNGCVELCVFDAGMHRVRACYHKSCNSSLFDHAGNKLLHVNDTGCWDFNEVSRVLYHAIQQGRDKFTEPGGDESDPPKVRKRK